MLYSPKQIQVIKEDEYLGCICEVEDILSQCASEGTFSSFDGVRIFYRNYLVQNPVGSIVIVHGFTEYCKKYIVCIQILWQIMVRHLLAVLIGVFFCVRMRWSVFLDRYLILCDNEFVRVIIL